MAPPCFEERRRAAPTLLRAVAAAGTFSTGCRTAAAAMILPEPPVRPGPAAGTLTVPFMGRMRCRGSRDRGKQCPVSGYARCTSEGHWNDRRPHLGHDWNGNTVFCGARKPTARVPPPALAAPTSPTAFYPVYETRSYCGSMVAGGLLEITYDTHVTPSISFVILLLILSRIPCGSLVQSAVIASTESTTLTVTIFP